MSAVEPADAVGPRVGWLGRGDTAAEAADQAQAQREAGAEDDDGEWQRRLR